MHHDGLLILALAIAVFVAACATVVPHGPGICPEPKAYTAAEETRAQAELLALRPDSLIAVMITDYGRERAELRACRSAGP